MRRVTGAVRQLAIDLNAARRDLFRDRSALIVANLLLLPWLAAILVRRDLNVWIPLAEIGGLILFYWFWTRRRPIEYLPVRQPFLESAFALILTLLWMLFRIGQYTHLLILPNMQFGFCNDWIATIIPKTIEMVVLPLGLAWVLGYRPGALGMGPGWRAWIPALVPLLVLTWWGLNNHTPAQLGERTMCFYLGAGLPEELLFRAFLQTRLEALTRSPTWGLYLASFIFGVTHLPINLSGAAPDNWLSAFESAFTFQLSIGFALGFAFQRVRNLWPLTLIHALIDSAP